MFQYFLRHSNFFLLRGETKMKKIFALVLVLSMICCMFVACENDPAVAAIKKADEALLKTPYAMTMKMDFSSSNKELDDVLSMMCVEVPTVVDGKNMSMNLNMNVQGYAVKAEVIVYDMVMYYDMYMMGQSMLFKCNMNDSQFKQFNESSNTQMPIGVDGFTKYTMEEKDGKQIISSGELTNKGLEEMNKMAADAVASMGAEASFSEIKYNVVLSDGKYESVSVDAKYSITMAGQTYDISMSIGAEYSYGDFASVVKPENADAYTEMDYEDLIGG